MQTKLTNEEVEPINSDSPPINKVTPTNQEDQIKSKANSTNKEPAKEELMTIQKMQMMYQTKKEDKAKNRIISWQKELTGCVFKIAISSDNKYLICAYSDEESIKVFELQTQKLIHRFKQAHKESIEALIVSPDNKYIISGSQDKSIKIFDIEGKKVVHHFQDAHEEKVRALAITPDGKFIVSCSDDHSIKLFNFQTKEQVHHFKDAHDYDVNYLAVSHDSRFIISCCYVSIKIHDIQTKQQVHKFEDAHSETINSVVITSDDKFVISASSDKSIKIFDLNTKQQVHNFKDAHQDGITSLALTSDNRFIISGSADKSIKIFDIETKNQVNHFQNVHEDNITTLAVTSENKYIISGSYDCFVKAFHFHVKQEAHTFEKPHEGWVRSVAVSPDNKFAISGSDDYSVKVYDLETREQVHQFKDAHQSDILALAITPDNKFIISGSMDKAINIFDFHSKELFHRFEIAHTTWFSALTVTPDSRFIISAGRTEKDHDIKWFDIQTKQQVHHIQMAHQDWISSLTVTSDNRYLISGSNDKSIKIFDLQTKQEIYNLQNVFQDRVIAVAVTSDSKFIISAGDAQSIKIFDFHTKQQIHHFHNVHDNITSLAITSDNRFIISGSHNQVIKIFDIHTKHQVHHYKTPNQCYISSLALTSDNRYIISGCELSLKIFDLYAKLPEEPEFIKPQISGMKEMVYEPFQRFSIQDPSIFKQEFHFVYEGIKQLSVFNCVDDFLFEKAPEYSVSQALKQKELFVLPFRWTILHLVSVFAHHDFIEQMPEYSEFQMPFLLDAFNRTPFHYLIAHKNMNFITVNIVFRYICDYLEDCSSKNPYGFQKIIESLSPLLPFILQKIENKSRQRFFSMVYAKSPAPHSNPVPLFGTSLFSDSAVISDSPVLTQEIKRQIWGSGETAQIEFRSNFLCLDYDILSQDMNEISECIKQQKSEEFFKIPAITKLIDHLWKQAEIPLMIFFAFYSAFIIALSVYLTFDDRSLPYEITLLAVSALLTINELWQLVNLKTDYLMNAWNLLDLAHLFLTAAFLIARIADNDNELARAWISTFIIVLGYLRWISLLKIFKPTRNLIQVVMTVVKDMVSFITIIVLIIVGFSVIFLVFNREAGYGDYLYEAYNVMYGPVDIAEEAAWPFSQKLIMAALAFFLNVVLLNLLISIMGDSYGQVLEMRDLTDSLTRLEMISEAAVYKKFLRPKHQTKRDFLVYCLPVELNDDDDENGQNSELESAIKTMKKIIQKNSEESKEEIQVLKEKVQENNLRLEATMKNEISNMKAEISNMKTEIFTYLQSEFSKLNSSQPTGGNYKKKVGIDYNAAFKKDLLDDSNPPEPEDFDIPHK